jgi:hypothetical protein
MAEPMGSNDLPDSHYLRLEHSDIKIAAFHIRAEHYTAKVFRPGVEEMWFIVPDVLHIERRYAVTRYVFDICIWGVIPKEGLYLRLVTLSADHSPRVSQGRMTYQAESQP